MPTGAAPYRPTPGLSFALRGVAWSLGLFSALRLDGFEIHAVLPFTQFQGRIAARAFGAPVLPIEVTLACSGADALALCAGAILAFPAPWRSRLAGVTGGITLILLLNTMRIGTLGRVAASPAWFSALHLYVWPAVLVLAIAGYVFAWMRRSELRRSAPSAHARAESGVPPRTEMAPLTRRFAVTSAALLVVFTALLPWYLENGAVLALAGYIAGAAAAVLSVLGVPSDAQGNVLSTSRGAFLVTQECISTPLIPVYLAAVIAYSRTGVQRTLALLAALPLFVALGILRLLVVALPPAIVASPMFLIHAFYQVLLAGVLVAAAAAWRHGAGAAAWRRALIAAAAGAALMYVLVPAYGRVLASVTAAGAPLEDPQGALAFLPPFQVGLYVALALALFTAARWLPLVTGLGVLALSQVACFVVLRLAADAGLGPHVREVRAWAVAGPLLLVAAMVTHDRARR